MPGYRHSGASPVLQYPSLNMNSPNLKRFPESKTRRATRFVTATSATLRPRPEVRVL